MGFRSREKILQGGTMKEQLTPEQIQDIKIMYAKGIGIKSIMEKYPAIRSRNTIYYHIYKTSQEIQQLNPLDSINSKLDQILHLLKNNSPINDNLKNGSTKLNNVLNDLNNVQDNQKKPQGEKPKIQTVKHNGKVWIKSNEACKLVFKNDRNNCSEYTIKLAYTTWNKQTNQNKEGSFSYGYILEDLLEALRYANETKDKKYHLDFSELENLIKL
jgi:hypothetical protein